MLERMFDLLPEIGPGTVWMLDLFAGVVAAFVVYIGILLWAVIRVNDPEKRKILYKILSDLIRLFDRRRRG